MWGLKTHESHEPVVNFTIQFINNGSFVEGSANEGENFVKWKKKLH